MGGTTPTVGLPYPAPPDPADVPADIEALAMALDALLGAPKPGPEVWAGYHFGNIAIPAGSNFATGVNLLGAAIPFDAGPTAADFLVSVSARVWNSSVQNAYNELSVVLDGAQHFVLGSGTFPTPGGGPPLFARGVLRGVGGAHTLNVRVYGTAAGTVGGGDGTPANDTPIVVMVERQLAVPVIAGATRPGPDDPVAAPKRKR